VICNRRERFVALRGCRFTWNGRYPRWNDDRRFRVTLGNSIVDNFTVIGTICPHRRDVTADLIKSVRQFGDVADIIRRQFNCDNFGRAGINTEMQLAPPPARSDAVFLIEPFAFAVNIAKHLNRV
jgi:hypothetical protein